MNLLASVRIALASLRSHKLRTFLTLLGNIVGTMSVIAVVSLIYGTDRYVSEVVLDEGTDVFTITRIDGLQFLTDFDAFLESLTNPDLTLEDRTYLQDRMTEAAASAACRRAGSPRTTPCWRTYPWPPAGTSRPRTWSAAARSWSWAGRWRRISSRDGPTPSAAN